MTAHGGGQAAGVECWCGGLIRQVTLPLDLAEATGEQHLWVHDHGDIYCYPDDQQACAEPYETVDAVSSTGEAAGDR